jgi:MFS family permease
MANPNASAETIKTPSYAIPCLIVSLLCAVSTVFAWQWLPGITFGVGGGWFSANNADWLAKLAALSANPDFNPAAMPGVMGIANIMGLVPIGAIIMALPTAIIVRRQGPKFGTLAGMVLSIVGSVLCAAFAASNWNLFLVGRFVLGLGLSTTIVSGPTCVSTWFPDATRGRAMAVWSCWAPIGIFTINAIGTQLWGATGGSMTNLLWLFVVILVVVALLFAFVYRTPREDERSQVSPELKPFKDIIQYFKSRQLWALILMFAIFNYMNYAFSQYLKTWMARPLELGGMGWGVENPFTHAYDLSAGYSILAGLIVACGVLAPLGGFFLDKTSRANKYLCVVAGITGLTVCSVFAFSNNPAAFIAYVLFFCIGNMFLNGCCRPMIPSFVFKGGATAVAFGLSFLTLGQYLGQIPTSYVFQLGTDLGWSYSQVALYCLVPVGVVGVILSFLIKPAKVPGGGAP